MIPEAPATPAYSAGADTWAADARRKRERVATATARRPPIVPPITFAAISVGLARRAGRRICTSSAVTEMSSETTTPSHSLRKSMVTKKPTGTNRRMFAPNSTKTVRIQVSPRSWRAQRLTAAMSKVGDSGEKRISATTAMYALRHQIAQVGRPPTCMPTLSHVQAPSAAFEMRRMP